MTFDFNIKRVNGLLLRAFLIATFFIYYLTKFVPGTLHAWILAVGLALTVAGMLSNAKRWNAIPIDYTVLGLFCLLLGLAFATNFGTATVSQLQAYLLAVGCYVFVRENASSLSPAFIASLMKYFLLINGVLVALQFVTGEFFPARYLAAGDPPLLIPSGVSDGPTKNGMLIAFALSFLLGKLLWDRARATKFELLVFAVGLVSLVLSMSRAGLLSFAVVMALAACFALFARRRFRVNGRNVVVLTFMMLVPVVVTLIGAVSLDTITGIRDPDADSYAAGVLVFKLTATEDDSLSDRYANVDHAIKMMEDSPLHLLSVGFGSGSFETLNEGLNLHNSYFEVLFETGIYGLLIFLFLVLHVVRKALSKDSPAVVLPLLFALVSVAVFMAFHDVLRGRTFWIPLAVLAAFAYEKKHAAAPRTVGSASHQSIAWRTPAGAGG